MRITELLKNKEQNRRSNRAVTIVFIGDSVTQGCFECYTKNDSSIETIFDYRSAYSTRVGDILHMLYPSAQVNIINSGISGDNAVGGNERFERDVLSYNPDLVVISFGLNDSCAGRAGISKYILALEEMFSALKARNIEAVFLTENIMCTHTSAHLKEDKFVSLSESFAEIQNSGLLKEYFVSAKKSCEKYGVKVCDLYSAWETLKNAGVNTTELLANKLNHPTREMHYYIAMKIVETFFAN